MHLKLISAHCENFKGFKAADVQLIIESSDTAPELGLPARGGFSLFAGWDTERKADGKTPMDIFAVL